MKTGKTFSIETELLRRFLALTDEKKIDHNAVLMTLIKQWVGEHTEVKMVVCGKCSANYSGLLDECPQCRLKRMFEKKRQELDALKIKRVKMETWLKEGKAQQNELDIIDVEIQALEKDLGDANEGD